MTRIASPCERTKALMAGLGPRKAKSMESERIASSAPGPALKTEVLSAAWEPSASAK